MRDYEGQVANLESAGLRGEVGRIVDPTASSPQSVSANLLRRGYEGREGRDGNLGTCEGCVSGKEKMKS